MNMDDSKLPRTIQPWGFSISNHAQRQRKERIGDDGACFLRHFTTQKGRISLFSLPFHKPFLPLTYFSHKVSNLQLQKNLLFLTCSNSISIKIEIWFPLRNTQWANTLIKFKVHWSLNLSLVYRRSTLLYSNWSFPPPCSFGAKFTIDNLALFICTCIICVCCIIYHSLCMYCITSTAR